jgi:hypothetical protein
MSKSWLTALAVLASFFVAGCAEPQAKLVDVEGTVKLNGQPLEKVRVEFWPLNNGPQSAALTDAEGEFVLETLDGTQKGAVVGKHKVVLKDMSIVTVPFRGRANEGVDMTEGKKPRTADKYTNVIKTPLEVEIAGENRGVALDVDPYGK